MIFFPTFINKIKKNGCLLKIFIYLSGMFTVLGITRRGYLDSSGRIIPMLYTKISEALTGTDADNFIQELVSCVSHRGGDTAGHFIAYSKLDNTDVWYINNDSEKVYQSSSHPFQSTNIYETVDMLVYKNV